MTRQNLMSYELWDPLEAPSNISVELLMSAITIAPIPLPENLGFFNLLRQLSPAESLAG